ncbi:MAG: hypothetical protein ACLUKN_11810 [Bacilli bacterium]
MKDLKDNNMPRQAKFRKDRFVMFVYALVAIFFALQFVIIFYSEIF